MTTPAAVVESRKWRSALIVAAALAVGAILRLAVGEWTTLALVAAAAVLVIIAGPQWERRYFVTAAAAIGSVVILGLALAAWSA